MTASGWEELLSTEMIKHLDNNTKIEVHLPQTHTPQRDQIVAKYTDFMQMDSKKRSKNYALMHGM